MCTLQSTRQHRQVVSGYLFLGADALLERLRRRRRFSAEAAHLLLVRGLAGSGASLRRSGSPYV